MSQAMSQSDNFPGGSCRLGPQQVARVGFGAMQLERLHRQRDQAVALLRQALAAGINHLDTAEFYGNGFVNDVIREAVAGAEGVVVVSKVGATPNPQGPLPLRPAQRPEELRASVEDNLRSLGCERLDVVNLRRLDVGPGIQAEGDQVVDLDDQLAEMIALREEGKIGAIGLSAVTLEILERALPAGIVCVQNAYSLVSREFEAMLQLCREQDIAWVPFFPLGGAFPGLPKVTEQPLVIAAAEKLGVTPSQVGLAWLLGHAPQMLLIPGTASPAHLAENIAAGSLVLDAETTASLDAMPIPQRTEIRWTPDAD